MPVSVLLCEGGPDSPDVRVIVRILTGLCEVRPHGSKYGMGTKIIARREVLGDGAVFGILDGDFRDWSFPQSKPRQWMVDNDTKHLGWRWERKEIENYLIDPLVVARALGAAPNSYSDALNKAADGLFAYQAARVALSLNRKRFSPLENSFGTGRGKHKHPIPDDCSEGACLVEAKRIVDAWNADRGLDPTQVESSFKKALLECGKDGSRRSDYLGAFAGKDLLWAINEDLKPMGFASSAVFIERVINGIESSTENIWDWLPEWKALREQIESI